MADVALRWTNDFFIHELKLLAYDGSDYDIRHLRVTLQIHEDLFGNFIVGKLSMYDTIDLPRLFPFIGEERLKISLTRPKEPPAVGLEDPYEAEFRIYKMSAQEMQKEKMQTYVLHFCSPEMINQNNHKVKRSYKDKKYSEMVEDIYGDFIQVSKPINIEPTKYEHHFVVSNKNPVEAINSFASRSESDTVEDWAFIFYEEMERFNFVSLGSLLEQAPIEEYTFGPKGLKKSSGGADEATLESEDQDLKIRLKTVESYAHAASFDIIKDQTVGKHNSRLFTYDPLRQIWEEEIDFDLDADWDSFNHLGKHKNYTESLDARGNPLAHTRLMRTNLGHDSGAIAAHEPGILPFMLEEYVQKRTSRFHQLNNRKIILTVSGDPRRHVGQKIKFNLPEQRGVVDHTKPQEFEKYLQGEWLIVGMTHRLEQEGYWMDLEIVKDAFNGKIEHEDVIKELEPTIIETSSMD